MINRKKEKITIYGSSWNKVKREKVYVVIWQPTQPFIFTATTMAGMEGEMSFLMIALHALSTPTPNKHFVATNNNNINNNNSNNNNNNNSDDNNNNDNNNIYIYIYIYIYYA